MRHPGELVLLGNEKIFKEKKIAFFCSRRYPATVVLPSYDWAIAKLNAGRCVLSGNHSRIEKEVVHFLLKGTQPMIIAMGRGLGKRMDSRLVEAVESGRLLMLSPFPDTLKRVTCETARIRNDVMAELADEIFVAYASPRGELEILSEIWIATGKPVYTFGVPENEGLIAAGAIGVESSPIRPPEDLPADQRKEST